jgi:hypothetical protein
LIALAGTQWFAPCRGQSSSEINTLLQKSKLVDTGRPVNTSLSADCAVISTFCDQRAADNDCKITALMMMKELRLHFKGIHRIRVLFFNQTDPTMYREIPIRESDVLLVDKGTPPATVLSHVDVINQKLRSVQARPITSRSSAGNRWDKRQPAQGSGSSAMKTLIMQWANTWHFTNAAEAIWDRHMAGKNASKQMTRAETTALYKDLKEQINSSVSADQRDQALFTLRQSFELLGGVDD